MSVPGPSILPVAAPRRVTIKDVAELAGVGNAAVSMVLNGARSGGTGVSDAARARIVAAAAELGYRRNGSMVAARSGRFKAVGLLLSTVPGRSTLPPLLCLSMLHELSAHDLHLIVQQLPDAVLTDESLVPKMLREWLCDGLLIDYTHAIPPAMLGLIRHNQMPAIWMNARLASDCVHPDDFEAGKMAAKYLLRLGHTNIVYASHLDAHRGEDTHFSVADRQEGCRAQLEAARLPMPCFSPPDALPYEGRVEQWAQRLRVRGRPTAVIVYGGFDGDVVLHAAERAGLSVPRDLSLVAFGGGSYTVRGQRVTLARLPEEEVGRASVHQLLRKIEQPDVELAPLRVPFSWDEGQTCAPPAR